jgi:DNA-nicking Smr family endonuclease
MMVTANVRPFRARPAPLAETAPSSAAKPSRQEPAAPFAHRDRPSAPKPPTPLVEIDHRTRAKIKRGRLEVDAKLDLHGMRQDEAQRALNAFLRRAQADGAKVAIVVTGKGLSREEGGVLRRVVPMWLQAPNLRDVVVGFGEAARHHGGEGALYVQIRRPDRRHSRYD